MIADFVEPSSDGDDENAKTFILVAIVFIRDRTAVIDAIS